MPKRGRANAHVYFGPDPATNVKPKGKKGPPRAPPTPASACHIQSSQCGKKRQIRASNPTIDEGGKKTRVLVKQESPDSKRGKVKRTVYQNRNLRVGKGESCPSEMERYKKKKKLGKVWKKKTLMGPPPQGEKLDCVIQKTRGRGKRSPRASAKKVLGPRGKCVREKALGADPVKKRRVPGTTGEKSTVETCSRGLEGTA